MKIVLTGGGTAGHVIPLIELANEFKRRKHRCVYIGAGEPEQSLVKGIKFIKVPAGKWRRYFSLWNFWDLLKFGAGKVKAYFVLRKLKPDLVFAKGGYVSLPVVIAAWILRIPIFIHESDSVMGFANRLATKFAKKVVVGFPLEHYRGVNFKKLIYTGVPVRQEFFRKKTLRDRVMFNLADNFPVVFVTGGSQGAVDLNNLVFKSLEKLLVKYQIIHITGDADAAKAIDLRNHLKITLQERYRIYKFLKNEIFSAMRAADIVVTRGGSTLFEVAAAGKQAVVVPLPSAAGDHQRKNAEVFKQMYGFEVLEQDSVSSAKLLTVIERALDNKKDSPQPPRAVKIIIDNLPLGDKI